MRVVLRVGNTLECALVVAHRPVFILPLLACVARKVRCGNIVLRSHMSMAIFPLGETIPLARADQGLCVVLRRGTISRLLLFYCTSAPTCNLKPGVTHWTGTVEESPTAQSTLCCFSDPLAQTIPGSFVLCDHQLLSLESIVHLVSGHWSVNCFHLRPFHCVLMSESGGSQP